MRENVHVTNDSGCSLFSKRNISYKLKHQISSVIIGDGIWTHPHLCQAFITKWLDHITHGNCMVPGTQVYSAWAFLCGRLEWVPGESWESKQAYHMIHQPVSVVLQCSLIAWLKGLASRDQRQLRGSGGTLEVISRNVLYKSTFTLLYFTLLAKQLR